MTLRQRAIPCDTVRHWRVPGRVLHIVQVETVSAQASMVATETKRKLTWKQRVLIALALCAAGVIYAVAAFLDEMAGYAGDRDGLVPVLLWFLPPSGIGALISGLLLASGFGHAGKKGWALSLVVGLIATTLSGAIGGTLIFPVFGTGLGAVFALGHMVQFPPLVLFWLALMAAVHKIAESVRRTG